jgi:hypothetical protein
MPEARTNGHRNNGHVKNGQSHEKIQAEETPGVRDPDMAPDNPDTELLKNLVDVQVSDRTAEIAGELLSQTLASSNVEVEDIHEARHMVRAYEPIIKASFPPQESAVTGAYGAAMLNRSKDEMREPLSAHEKIDLEIVARIIASYHVAKSDDGWLAERVAEGHSTVKQIRAMEQPNDDSGGWLSGVFS